MARDVRKLFHLIVVTKPPPAEGAKKSERFREFRAEPRKPADKPPNPQASRFRKISR
jgi:hypothetical protein